MAKGSASLRVRIFWATWKGTSAREVASYFAPFFQREAERAEKRYAKITDSWQGHHQPSWSLDLLSGRDAIGFRHYTTDDIFVYLAEGTRKRYAQMERDYSAKTRKRRFGTYGFGGEPVRAGKRALKGRSLKGIQAREWHYQIADDLRRSSRLQKEMQNIFFAIAQQYGTIGAFGRGGATGLSLAKGKKMIKEQVTFEV